MNNPSPNAAYYAEILNALPNIAWTNTLSGEVTFYNQRWYDYTGLNFEQTKNWGWRSIIHPDDIQYNMDAYAAILQSKTEGSFEIRELSAAGVYRWHLVRISPVKNETGDISFWVGTATDIQDLKDLERQKDEFLSVASHELKTPLTNIKAYNQLTLRTTDTEKMHGFARKTAEHINRLEKLVTELLDVSRINAGEMRFAHASFRFDHMLREIAESMQQASAQHNIILAHIAEADFTGDQMRLEQVLLNLMGNAIKYSPAGGDIIIESNVVQNGIVVSIQDHGIGIAPQHLSQLFERYYRIDKTSMKFDGFGLGLFISSEIIKGHGGSLWIESEPGKGSTFFFRLPFDYDAVEPVADNDTYFSDASVTMGCIANRIELTWHGFQNTISIQRVCMRLLKLVKTNNVARILADNTYVAGDWSEASAWVGETYLPMLDEAGVKQMAWVVSKSTFSRMAEERTVALFNGNLSIRFFPTRQEAVSWLAGE